MADPDRLREEAKAVLSRFWGFSSFRSSQFPIISALVSGRDVMAVMPTGGGKSLCYQIPGLITSRLTIVVSPLIALMEDQVISLLRRGVSATSLAGPIGSFAMDSRLNDARFGKYSILYISPERLLSQSVQDRLGQLDVGLIAIDEAHCVSEWGHEFRPEYRKIPEIYTLIKRPPILAVTASATPGMRSDIAGNLKLSDPFEISDSFDRPNIVFSVFRTHAKRKRVTEILDAVPGSSVLYVQTRKDTVRWQEFLQKRGESVSVYHGGLDFGKRSAALQNWLDGRVRVMVATNAFGMGIDKPDVRTVIHDGIPLSLEAYYQEAGRAGRDGERSFATLLVGRDDISRQEDMLSAVSPSPARMRKVYDAVCSTAGVAVGSRDVGGLMFREEAVQRATSLSAFEIRSAVAALEREGVWASRRTGADSRRSASDTDTKKVARQNDSGSRDLLVLSAPRHRVAPLDSLRLRRLRRRADSRLKAIAAYAESDSCRRRQLLGHFGEYSIRDCGTCDVCMGRHRPFRPEERMVPIIQSVLRTIDEGLSPYSTESVSFPAYRIEQVVDWLIQTGHLKEGEFPGSLPRLSTLGCSLLLRGDI
jgi:ATP-dependent DNA helicase RecQ